ncbi:hypothetical protein ML436_06265 [Staphylococcus roterodami]|nr:hypothetical protein ML436_06265 [Staphylococcus roterodami]
MDSKTSKLCHSLNGKIFKVKDMIPGVNAPYIHPCVEVKEAIINNYLFITKLYYCINSKT